jgi:hypothetical protein
VELQTEHQIRKKRTKILISCIIPAEFQAAILSLCLKVALRQ